LHDGKLRTRRNAQRALMATLILLALSGGVVAASANRRAWGAAIVLIFATAFTFAHQRRRESDGLMGIVLFILIATELALA
jgi:hypothetical protein